MKRCTKCGEIKALSEFYKSRDSHTCRCKNCLRPQNKEYYARNKQKHRDAARRYRLKHADEIKAKRLANREQYMRSRLGVYGMSVSEFNRMLDEQNGVCAICGDTDQRGRSLSVDHNHETGQIRALLCNNCNTGLGYFRESPEIMRLAADYIEQHRQAEVKAA